MICAPTTDNATWCLTPASCSAARRFVVVVVKKCITGSSSNNGESATSTRTSAPATALARPSPVSESTPDRREAAITLCPCALSLVATLEPISPRPPMTTIFMMNLSELRLIGHFGFVPSTVGHPRWLACFPPTLLGHTAISNPSVHNEQVHRGISNRSVCTIRGHCRHPSPARTAHRVHLGRLSISCPHRRGQKARRRTAQIPRGK